MNISVAPVQIDPDPAVVAVEITDSAVLLVLADARELSAPLAWFPRLRGATADARRNWRLIGDGHGIRWPDVDEDVSVRSLLGRPT